MAEHENNTTLDIVDRLKAIFASKVVKATDPETSFFDTAEARTENVQHAAAIDNLYRANGCLAWSQPRDERGIIAVESGQGLIVFSVSGFNAETANFGPFAFWKESETLYEANAALKAENKKHVPHFKYNNRYFVRGGALARGLSVDMNGAIVRFDHQSVTLADTSEADRLWSSRIFGAMSDWTAVEFDRSVDRLITRR